MTMPTFTIRDLLQAGVHYGHTTRRWNPKMAPYIFGERGGVHIMDLQQTVPMLHRALEALKACVEKGGRVLFVGTKMQASDAVREAAIRCGQYYVNHRWLGGMLTNWKTVNQSIKTLKKMREDLADPSGLTKKEILKLQREHDKLDAAVGGITEMAGIPDLIFIIDTNKEDIAVLEAQKLNIPIVAIVDSNSDPDGIVYPIPGNDDATRAIELYTQLVSDAILDGLQNSMLKAGIDVGASKSAPAEVIEEIVVEDVKGEAKAESATSAS